MGDERDESTRRAERDSSRDIRAYEAVADEMTGTSETPTLGFEDLPDEMTRCVRTLCALFNLRCDAGVTISELARQTGQSEDEERECLATLRVQRLAEALPDRPHLYQITPDGVDIVQANQTRDGPVS